MDCSSRVLSFILCVVLIHGILSADVTYIERQKRQNGNNYINHTTLEEEINLVLENKFKEFKAELNGLFENLEINLLEKLSEKISKTEHELSLQNRA